ncbi:hybrid sensor histidine kinase/response regulator, partial [Dysgonomonas sp. Marseille-P4677]|uniref:ligand-binding sensor domain-containing protein n=1 Tax=Dysgonomonas sp. Marseille-P4677 TaxID=2364790 RepID=UPI001913F7C0
MRVILILLILSFSNLHLSSSDIKFHSINTIYGISMREVSSVCKDGNGFIWGASKTGVLRIAGDNYHVYQLPYKTVDISFSKLIYKNSQLIVYTNNGQIFAYNELYDKFVPFIDLRNLLQDRYATINSVDIDDSGKIWIASSNGLYNYKDGILDTIQQRKTDTNYIYTLDNNHLLYADQNKIALLNPETLKDELIYTNKLNNTIQVSSCFYDKKSETLWIGTFSHGLFEYNLKTKSFNEVFIEGFPKQPVLALDGNLDSSLFVGIDGQGVWEIGLENKSVLNIYKEEVDNPSSLRGDGVYDIFCDDNQKIWVATYTGGLSYFEKDTPLINQITHQINNINSLGNNDVHQILEDRKGDIWFATNNGISCWRASSSQWELYYQNKKEQAQVFLALCEDKEGHIWAGTYSSGIYILDRDTGQELAHYSENKRESNKPGKFIFDIFKDSDGDIWIGGVDDVTCYFSKEKQFRSYSIKPVNSFWELTKDKILVTLSQGLSLINKKTGEIEILLDNCMAHDVAVVGDDIWLATSGNGLIQYNHIDKRKKQFSTDSGLPSNYINSIISTNDYLWIGTENGLCQLNLTNNKILTYSSVLALSNTSFNINSCTQLKNGDLVWGTNSGAIMYTPDKLYQASFDGRIFFQNITVSGRSIRENPDIVKNTAVDKQTSITLNHDQNTLSLELLSIGISSKSAKYSWKLEGLDSEWSQPSGFSIINYTNLPSGNFNLLIRMYDSSISQVIDQRSLAIHIIPPFWETWWFRSAFVIAILGILYFSLRFYINQIKQKHAEDKIRFFTSMAHEMRTSLTLINAPIEQLNNATEFSTKTRYYLSLATEQSRRLSLVVTQLLDFEKIDSGKGQLFPIMTEIVQLVSNRIQIFSSIAENRNIELVFSSNMESYITAIDELKIEKVIDNLLSNAIKYSYKNSKIEIFLFCEEK